MVKWFARSRKPPAWEATPVGLEKTLHETSEPRTSTPLQVPPCTTLYGYRSIRRNLCESLEKTESTDLSVSQDKDKSSHSANISSEMEKYGGDVFSTPWTAATRQGRPITGTKSTVRFNEKTIYHEYKARSRVKTQESTSQEGSGRKKLIIPEHRPAVYGGRGDNPGVITTVTEMAQSELQFENRYEVVSSYSSFRNGRWGLTPVSVVQCLNHRDVTRTHTLMLFREMDVLSVLRHPYIVQLIGVCSGPRSRDVMLVLEPFYGGTLYSALHKQKRQLSKREVVDIARNICCALDYIHSKGYIHNGISSHSIFLGKEAKLGNMGYVQPRSVDVTFNTGHYWQWSDVWINEEELSVTSDVYSIGCVLWECQTGKVPWDGYSRESVLLHVCKGKRLCRLRGGGTIANITMQILNKKLVCLGKILQYLGNH